MLSGISSWMEGDKGVKGQLFCVFLFDVCVVPGPQLVWLTVDVQQKNVPEEQYHSE